MSLRVPWNTVHQDYKDDVTPRSLEEEKVWFNLNVTNAALDLP